MDTNIQWRQNVFAMHGVRLPLLHLFHSGLRNDVTPDRRRSVLWVFLTEISVRYSSMDNYIARLRKHTKGAATVLDHRFASLS